MSWMGFVSSPYGGMNGPYTEALAFNIYADHTSRLDEVAKRLAAADDPNDETEQFRAFLAAGLENTDLTEADEQYIVDQIHKIWND